MPAAFVTEMTSIDFNVIKGFDPYDERNRHANTDFPERMSENELKQSAIIKTKLSLHSILDHNCAHLYALSVGTQGDRLQ